MCATALKNASWQPATATSPYAVINGAMRRSRRHRPRSCTTAIGASTAAASRTRTATAAAEDQPASINPRASGPDNPKDDADSSANPNPARRPPTCTSCVIVAMTHDAMDLGSNLSTCFSPMTRPRRSSPRSPW